MGRMIRFTGIVLLLLSAVALGADLNEMTHAEQFRLRPLGEMLYGIDPSILNLLQSVIQRYIAPWVWEDGVQNILLLPTVLVTGGLGLACLLRLPIGRRRSDTGSAAPSSDLAPRGSYSDTAALIEVPPTSQTAAIDPPVGRRPAHLRKSDARAFAQQIATGRVPPPSVAMPYPGGRSEMGDVRVSRGNVFA